MVTGRTQPDVVCLNVRTPSRDLAERLMAEAWEFGALGIEEREQGSRVDLDLYVGVQEESNLRARLDPFVADGVVWGNRVIVGKADWSEAWKAGLTCSRLRTPTSTSRPRRGASCCAGAFRREARAPRTTRTARWSRSRQSRAPRRVVP